MSSTWLIGVFLSLLACTVGDIGVNLQKLAHLRGQRIDLCNRIWLLGLSLVIVGALLDLVSFTFAAVSLLAPVGATTLLINLLVAQCLVHEISTRRDVIWTSVICVGAVVTVGFGSKTEPDYDLQTLVDLYFQHTVLAYFLMVGLYVTCLFILLFRCRARPDTPGKRRFQAFAFASTAGAVGSVSVLFAKSVGKLVQTTVEGDNQFRQGTSYALAIAMLVAVVLQAFFLNLALANDSSLFVVPVYQAFWVVSSCCVGMLYFGDYQTMSSVDLGMFFFGIFVAVSGLVALCMRPVDYEAHFPITSQPTTRRRSSSVGDGQAQR